VRSRRRRSSSVPSLRRHYPDQVSGGRPSSPLSPLGRELPRWSLQWILRAVSPIAGEASLEAASGLDRRFRSRHLHSSAKGGSMTEFVILLVDLGLVVVASAVAIVARGRMSSLLATG